MSRSVEPTIPPRVDYELTALGQTLLEPVTALAGWARKYRTAIQEARQRYDARQKRAAAKAAVKRGEPESLPAGGGAPWPRTM